MARPDTDWPSCPLCGHAAVEQRVEPMGPPTYLCAAGHAFTEDGGLLIPPRQAPT